MATDRDRATVPIAGGGAMPLVGLGTWEMTGAPCHRAVGVSNFDVDELDELVRATGEAPAVNQIRWGPTLFDPGLVEEHAGRGVVLEGYSPFKSTDLHDPVLADVARRHGVTPAQVVVRWHVDRGVVVIPKSATPERIAANFHVFGFSLDDEERRRIDALSATARR